MSTLPTKGALAPLADAALLALELVSYAHGGLHQSQVPVQALERDLLLRPAEFAHVANRAERLLILMRGRVQVYEVDDAGREFTLSVAENGRYWMTGCITGKLLLGHDAPAPGGCGTTPRTGRRVPPKASLAQFLHGSGRYVGIAHNHV